ncbi:MAG: hypothetical protein KDK50_05970, partial [Chlamydiia bacterium]|nr:hypothetical protein [Chlamydiia bacterium]
YLHQGSLSLSIPPISLLTTLLKNGAAVAPLMHQNTFPLLPKNTAKKTFVDQLKKLLITSITAN